jgi:hypothetical protein
MRGGTPSVLKRVLQHDLGASLPMTLVISEVRTNAGRGSGPANGPKPAGARGGAPQQRGGGHEAPEEGAAGVAAAGAGGGGAAGAAQVLGVQLSDGWYWVNACVDEPLAQLLLTGRLQVRAPKWGCTKW